MTDALRADAEHVTGFEMLLAAATVTKNLGRSLMLLVPPQETEVTRSAIENAIAKIYEPFKSGVVN